MINNYLEFFKVLKPISDNNFSSELVLMGSWNEFFYAQIYDNYNTYMSTLDIDFYCINRNKQKDAIAIKNLLKLTSEKSSF